jgi:hypothetical protein
MMRESMITQGLLFVLCAATGDAVFAGDGVGGWDAPSGVSLSLRWQGEDGGNVGGETDGEGFEGGGVIEPGEDEIAELAKATQNPVADMISLPFQNNTYFQLGDYGRAANVLNIQPVVPIDLSDEWLLITRTILPVTYRPALFRGDSDEFGLGDLQITGWFSPKGDSSFIWGVGPVLRFPTATDDSLGSEKWSAGASFVALTMQGPWVAGGLVQNVWSYCGDSDRPHVNEFLLQPFVNYNLEKGWYLVSAPIMTANWNRDSSDQWLIPVGGGMGRVFKIGKLPVNLQVQAFYHAAKPSEGPDWSTRVQFQLLFPRKKKG